MAEDILEQKTSGTFAEDLGVEVEYAEVEDVSAEHFNKSVETAAAELNPDLGKNVDLTYEDEDEEQDSVEFGEYISFLGSLIQEQSTKMDFIGKRLDMISFKLDSLQEVISELTENVAIEPLDPEDVFEDEDLDDYEPKRKGTPGRPVKEAPKTVMPPKRKKPKKTAVKKKVTTKTAVKKKAPAKKKAAKKKSKR